MEVAKACGILAKNKHNQCFWHSFVKSAEEHVQCFSYLILFIQENQQHQCDSKLASVLIR